MGRPPGNNASRFESYGIPPSNFRTRNMQSRCGQIKERAKGPLSRTVEKLFAEISSPRQTTASSTLTRRFC
jgi:hypothetical protein